MGRENPKLGSVGAGRARPTAVERREGWRRGKRTERGGCSRLFVRRLESREAKAKEDRRASIALRRVEQVARWLRGAGWREQVAHRLPTRCCLTRSSWSALFGRCRRCWEPAPPSGQSNSGVVVWARVLPRLAKLGVLLGCHMSPPSRPLMSDSYFVVGALWSLPTLLRRRASGTPAFLQSERTLHASTVAFTCQCGKYITCTTTKHRSKSA